MTIIYRRKDNNAHQVDGDIYDANLFPVARVTSNYAEGEFEIGLRPLTKMGDCEYVEEGLNTQQVIDALIKEGIPADIAQQAVQEQKISNFVKPGHTSDADADAADADADAADADAEFDSNT